MWTIKYAIVKLPEEPSLFVDMLVVVVILVVVVVVVDGVGF